MKSYIENNSFVVRLSNDESIALGQGGTLVDRTNPLWAEARVEVYPYANLDPAFADVQEITSGNLWDQRVYGVATMARFLTNMDLQLFVPQEVPRFGLVSGERIARDEVNTLVVGDRRTELLSALPERGVWLRFS